MNSKYLPAVESELINILKKSIEELEARNDIVICSSESTFVVDFLYNRIWNLIPNNSLTISELIGLRSLILHAIDDEKFFDWEMPTLTGFNAKEFLDIANKLPKG